MDLNFIEMLFFSITKAIFNSWLRVAPLILILHDQSEVKYIIFTIPIGKCNSRNSR